MYFQFATALMRYAINRGVLRWRDTVNGEVIEQIATETAVKAVRHYYLEDHLARVERGATKSRDYVINNWLKAQDWKFRATYVRCARSVAVLGGNIFYGGKRLKISAVHNKFYDDFFTKLEPQRLSTAMLVGGVAGSTWWGHWLEDELPAMLVANQYSDKFVRHPRPMYRHEAFYMNLFDLKKPVEVNGCYIDELFYVDEQGPNCHKIARYWEMKAVVGRLLAESCNRKPNRVYLRRGSTGAVRKIQNEYDVEKALIRHGFNIIDVESALPEQILESLSNAEIVLAVEGSHIAPALFSMQTYTLLVIICPPWQVHTTVADLGVMCGISSALFIAENGGSGGVDFAVNCDELLTFIDGAVAYAECNKSEIDRFLSQVGRF